MGHERGVKTDSFGMENLRPYRHTALRKDNIFCNLAVVHTCKQVPDCYIELLTEFRRGKYLFSQASCSGFMRLEAY